MTGIIEWTHDSQCADGSPSTLGVPRWHDDLIHGVLFETDKEYDFFAAIAGVRSRFKKPSLIQARGVPLTLSGPAVNYFNTYGEEVAGWLHLSEIEQCIHHIADGEFYTGFELDSAMYLMRHLVSRLTDSHVRLVFNIEGA